MTTKLLLQNEQLIKDLNDMLITAVIDLSDDEISTKPVALENASDVDSVMDVDLNLEENKLNLNDVVDSVREHLEIEKTFSDIAIKKLINLNEDELDDVYVMLLQQLDTDLICKFGNGILKSDPRGNKIIETFVKRILIPKVFMYLLCIVSVFRVNYFFLAIPRI